MYSDCEDDVTVQSLVMTNFVRARVCDQLGHLNLVT